MVLTRKKREYGVVVVLVLLVCAMVPMRLVCAEGAPIAEANGPYLTDECIGTWLDASGSSDPDNDSLQYRWLIDGEWTSWSSNPFYEQVWRDDYLGTVWLEVTDGISYTSDSAEVIVGNVPPFIISTVGPMNPITIGDAAQVTVEFYDGDLRSEIPSLDTYTAVFYWDDGAMSEYDLGIGEFTFTGSHVYTEPGEYEVMVMITDDDGGTTMDTVIVYVIAGNGFLVDAGLDSTIDEGSMFLSAGFFTDSGYNPYTATVDYGDGSGSQVLDLYPDNTFDLNHLFCENGCYAATVTVMDSVYHTVTDSVNVTVENVPPVITELNGPPTDPISINVSIMLNGVFTDLGCLDTHIATIIWDDNQTSVINVPFGVYHVTHNHTYSEAGVYTITFIVTDDDGGADSQTIETYVVVYDPDSGFVTGGGWITSPEGAYPADPTLTGRANFGFVSKYKKGQSIPTGNTEFQFQMANLNFHSHTYDWLVVAGPKAMYKGVGTINGVGNYGFMLTGIDGQINGGGGVDKFRIKIWDKDNNDVIIYDNNIGLPDDGNPTTILGGGQITIHKK
ncbi:MAG: PKD domain-containing protein [Methanobacteriota archaeon]